MLRRAAALIALLPVCLPAGDAFVVVQPGHASVDPQGVLATGRVPVGGSGLLRVVGGFRHLQIEDGEDDFSLGPTRGGARAEVIVTEALLVAHLLQDIPTTDEVEDALDLNRDGEFSIGDLVWVVEYPGDQVDVGGDPLAPVALRPDGEGPLAEDDLISTLLPRIVTEGVDPVFGDDGAFAGQVQTDEVESLISLIPTPLAARRGETFTLALQIDARMGFDNTHGYSALISLPDDLQFVGFPRGAAMNEDFESQPVFQFSDDRHLLLLEEEVLEREDVSEPVINVANVDVQVLETAPVGVDVPIVISEGSLLFQAGPVIGPPTVKLLGCTVRVEPF